MKEVCIVSSKSSFQKNDVMNIMWAMKNESGDLDRNLLACLLVNLLSNLSKVWESSKLLIRDDKICLIIDK